MNSAIHTVNETIESNVSTINEQIALKQDILTAGDGIKIEGNTISAYGGGVDYNLITMSKARYDRLVERQLVDPNTYYFTYEQETPSGNTWHFGDEFPIVLTDTWEFGGTFPITLS